MREKDIFCILFLSPNSCEYQWPDKVKPGSSNSILVSCMHGRGPRSWTILCFLPYALSGSWLEAVIYLSSFSIWHMTYPHTDVSRSSVIFDLLSCKSWYVLLLSDSRGLLQSSVRFSVLFFFMKPIYVWKNFWEES